MKIWEACEGRETVVDLPFCAECRQDIPSRTLCYETNFGYLCLECGGIELDTSEEEA